MLEMWLEATPRLKLANSRRERASLTNFNAKCNFNSFSSASLKVAEISLIRILDHPVTLTIIALGVTESRIIDADIFPERSGHALANSGTSSLISLHGALFGEFLTLLGYYHTRAKVAGNSN